MMIRTRRSFAICFLVSALFASASSAMVNSDGFSGLEGATNGILLNKGEFSFNVHALTYQRHFTQFTQFYADGTKFLKDAEVRSVDVNFAGGLGINKRVELGFYLQHRAVTVLDANYSASFVSDSYGETQSKEKAEQGLAYGGLGANVLLYGNSVKQMWSSLYVQMNMPIGDDFRGLSLGDVDVCIGGTFTKRVRDFGLHINGDYRFLGKESDFLVDGSDNQFTGFGRGSIVLEYQPAAWVQLQTGFEIEGGLKLQYLWQKTNRQTFSLGARFFARSGKKKSVEESLKSSKYFLAFTVLGTYAIDDASDEKPVGAHFGIAVGPKSDQDSLVASIGPSAPSLVLAQNDAQRSESVEVLALTNGVEREKAEYRWTKASGETVVTNNPSYTLPRAELAGLRCAVVKEGITLATDSLR